MLTKILNSLERKKSRRNTASKILEAPIKNKGVLNIHCYDTPNVGDLFCAPHNYFEKLKGTALDILDYYNDDNDKVQDYQERIINNQLIIGGGGLLNRNGFKFAMELFEKLADKKKKTVLWGPGHNSKKQSDFDNITAYNIDISKFGLAGTRDYRMPGDYVPCVSCMHPIFDHEFTESQKTGLVFHKDTLENKTLTAQFKDYPSTANTEDLESLINFIGTTETIITDSYHAMYWSMLLNKKVAVVPNSSKFFDFKYKPIFTTFENCIEDSKQAQRETGILEESRSINLSYYEKVGDYLNL